MKHRRSIDPLAGDGSLLLLLFFLLLLLLATRSTDAQPSNNSSSGGNNPYGFNTTFNPSMAIVIVVLISAFFFIVFLSMYVRQCGNRDRVDPLVAAAAAARSRRQKGLAPEVLATFPTLVYSEVKGLKIGKDTLECAVCLSEFEDDETLRLLPNCSHVFHPDCIDAWLASHVTCPVCRYNLAGATENPAAYVDAEEPALPDPVENEPPLPDHVAIAVDEGTSGDRKAELDELARIGSRRRAAGSRSRARPPQFPRSHSTGHSLVPVQQGDNLDRFTLRLPEDIRREIVAAGRIQRAASLRAFPVGLDGGSRRGNRGFERSVRAGRSIRLGRSGQWSSFFGRNFSARVPAWASGRRSEEEGTMRKEEGGEGSTRGKISVVKPDAGGKDESSAGAVARV